MRLVVGLGNPGERYARTRHNIGFLVADRLAAEAGASWRGDGDLPGDWVQYEQVALLKPLTYMNSSGVAVEALARRLAVELEQILVVFDDFALDFGRVRLRRAGSDGGHNGLASVIDRLGSDKVPRLRLGIGSPPAAEAIIDYVLSPFGEDEDLVGLIDRGTAAVNCYLKEGAAEAMNRFNGCGSL